MYDHERWRNTKQTKQDNPCLWFLFYFTSLSTRTWPLHYCLRHGVFAYFFLSFSKKYRKLLKSTNVILKSTANIYQQDTDYANDDNTFDVDDTISINEGRDGDNDDRFPKIQFPFFEALK